MIEVHVNILLDSLSKTDRRFHRRGQHLAQQDDARGTGTIGDHSFENRLQRFGERKAGGYALAGNQQTVQVLHACLQAYTHLFKGAAQLADLIFAFHAQGAVKLARCQIFRLGGEALQRPCDRAQVDPQGNQRHQPQQDDH